LAPVLVLTPTRWYSWDFRVTANGQEIALIDRDWFRERATFAIDGKSYEVRRTSMLRSSFVLERGGTVIAEATKPSSFRRTFEVTVGDKRLTLRAVSVFRWEFHLFDGPTWVGRIRRVSVFRRRATAEFLEGMSREVQLLVVFLVLVLWKRSTDRAAS
jgi:hypothetical protein